ncbi:MAG TPA: DNA-directed RNA polymerase subunit beta', partial [Flavobacteriales bacterium]|nr:DNA-directed RNA polymerase subunit beta' [Flavobacteriales bacterium]
TSDLNDLYRRVSNRNNRLKRLVEIKAPEVILRNEKRMLQEAVDSLFDNSRKSSAVKSENNRPLKSLSDSLKGKQGRFRQNLLGKRVDYSARSVIVVGPDLKLHECGLPKDMAAELYKPFIICKLIERGIVKTVKSAKKIVDKKEPVVWDILENVIKGHPVLLNRAPTLHRLGIQAFQPKLIEGKAIQLHPLSTTAFNADFDGDQMAVHLPLGHAAVLEAQLLMLASHNILNPANGAPIAVPSQDMVLGLYYITKGRKSEKGNPVQGEGSIFYSPEEVNIAFNEKRLDMHAWIKVRWTNPDGSTQLIETTTGRVIFNALVPEELGYINEVLTKRSLRDIIGRVVRESGVAKAAKFLDDIKELGFMNAFRGGLSFNLADVVIPAEKEKLIAAARSEADEVTGNYNMGLITNNERYNQTIDIWTHTNSKLTFALMERLKNDNQGFNSIYMMMDSGARGSKEQIRQLSGMRGLMAKPQKSGGGQDIIENPILSNFKEGLSILEYFISTHGARKGLADTALKTADAGYLTRRLVDVAQDVVISADDCGTLRGLVVTDLVKNDEVVEKLSDRILGRTVVNDVVHPQTGELIIASGENVTEQIAEIIGNSPIEEVEVRSVLTCEQRHGVCTKCYGRNLATGRMVQIGEAVGVIAAQSIGEPGTQLTLRTFHVGGVAGKITEDSRIVAKYDGRLEIDELRTVKKKDRNGQDAEVVISRSAEMRIVDANTGIVLTTNHIPYGAMYHGKVGKPVAKGELIADWDPYNAVIISELSGLLAFENIEENATFREEIDEQTGFTEKVIVESRDKRKNPTIRILDVKTKEEIKSYSLPVGAHISVNDGAKVEAGDILVKIPRTSGKGGDITGGLPRVTELFEARNPSNPAVVSEIDGIVSYGKIKRGNREIIVESRIGEHKYYLVPLSKHILVQENDFVKAGQPLSDGATSPSDILDIQGPTRVQEYLVDEVQDVYRMQGVKINDKHFEVIVRQMMRKVEIEDPGDTRFLERQAVMKAEFMEENDNLFDKLVVANAGDSPNVKEGQIITLRKLRDENSVLKRKDGKLVETRPATPATSKQLLMGITRASLQTESFISAASFQETTKVLNEAAVAAKEDSLLGLKENVIVGHLIPAGTGTRSFQKDLVYSKDEYTKLMAAKLTAQEIEE